LINAIEYAFVLCSNGEIEPHHLPPNITGKSRYFWGKRLKKRPPRTEQKEAILAALKKTGGKKTEAAELLGISRVTLWKRLKELDIQVNRTIQG